MDTIQQLLVRVILNGIKLYKIWVSPLLSPKCRYYPSCSEYAAKALVDYGLFRGTWLFVKRFSRCHPFSRGGVDPVPERVEKQRDIS